MRGRLIGDVYAAVACGLEGVNLGRVPDVLIDVLGRIWFAAAAFAMIVVPGSVRC